MTLEYVETEKKIYTVDYEWKYGGGGPEGLEVEIFGIVDAETMVPVPEGTEEWNVVAKKTEEIVRKDFIFEVREDYLKALEEEDF
ncbi:MAG TPA: hypothetical protein ENL33_01105 [Candidatus Parcubacteria bacterium]|nr:hypothetical protein [Candidatus Parcubacteria bacterium]